MDPYGHHNWTIRYPLDLAHEYTTSSIDVPVRLLRMFFAFFNLTIRGHAPVSCMKMMQLTTCTTLNATYCQGVCA
jgi:hypothetical protein